METIIMTCKNPDGKTIEKEVEERLVSIYEANGWTIKKESKYEFAEGKKVKSFTSDIDK